MIEPEEFSYKVKLGSWDYLITYPMYQEIWWGNGEKYRPEKSFIRFILDNHHREIVNSIRDITTEELILSELIVEQTIWGSAHIVKGDKLDEFRTGLYEIIASEKSLMESYMMEGELIKGRLNDAIKAYDAWQKRLNNVSKEVNKRETKLSIFRWLNKRYNK